MDDDHLNYITKLKRWGWGEYKIYIFLKLFYNVKFNSPKILIFDFDFYSIPNEKKSNFTLAP
jgi:hypothetical protein